MTAGDQAEFDAFLRAILTAPADDLPRLIAADWCEERGYVWAADCLRWLKRIPLGGPDVRACEWLLGAQLRSSFVRDVCRGVKVLQERADCRPGPLTRQKFVKDRLSPKQFLWVWRLVYDYRDRGRPELVERAKSLLPTEVLRGAERC